MSSYVGPEARLQAQRYGKAGAETSENTTFSACRLQGVGCRRRAPSGRCLGWLVQRGVSVAQRGEKTRFVLVETRSDLVFPRSDLVFSPREGGEAERLQLCGVGHPASGGSTCQTRGLERADTVPQR